MKWNIIKNVTDLPELEISWNDRFSEREGWPAEDGPYDSGTAIFTLENEDGDKTIAIGRVNFYKNADLSAVANWDGDYWFDGVAIAPSHFVGDEYRYLSGQIPLKPVAWMPYRPFDD